MNFVGLSMNETDRSSALSVFLVQKSCPVDSSMTVFGVVDSLP